MKRRRWLFPIAALLIVLAFAWIAWPRDRSLLARATRLPVRPNTEADSLLFYGWLSDTDLFLSRYADSRHGYFRLDTRTGKETPLDLKLKTEQMVMELNVCAGTLWINFGMAEALKNGEEGQDEYDQLVDIKTGHSFRSRSFLGWLADGKQWLEPKDRLVDCSRIIVHSLEAPKETKALTINSPRPLNLLGAVMTPQNHLLQTPGSFDIVGTREKTDEYSLDGKMTLLKTHAARLPSHNEIVEKVVSPKGDRIAWMLYAVRVPLLAQFRHRLFPSYQVKAEQILELWVTGLDGGDAKQLGALTGTFDHVTGGFVDFDLRKQPRPHNIQWTPDSKSLSFLHGEGVYRISAE